MATVTETKTFHLTGYDATHTVVKSVSGTTNFVGKDETNTTYGSFNCITSATNAYTYVYLTFDLSSIPQGATVTEVVRTNIKIDRSQGTGYLKNTYLRNYWINESGTLAQLGTSYRAFSNTTQAYQLACGIAQMQQVLDSSNRQYLIRAEGQRGSQSGGCPIRVYGATMTITYEYDDNPTDSLYVKNNGLWVPVTKALKKVSGAWVEESDLTQVFDSSNEYIRGNTS